MGRRTTPRCRHGGGSGGWWPDRAINAGVHGQSRRSWAITARMGFPIRPVQSAPLYSSFGRGYGPLVRTALSIHNPCARTQLRCPADARPCPAPCRRRRADPGWQDVGRGGPPRCPLLLAEPRPVEARPVKQPAEGRGSTAVSGTEKQLSDSRRGSETQSLVAAASGRGCPSPVAHPCPEQAQSSRD